MIDFSDLIIRWTFGETKERTTSLQAFDMLECSVLWAKKIFPKSKRYIIFNSLKDLKSLDRLKKIAHKNAYLLEVKSNWNNDTKNSFWKYVPLRVDENKYELLLDSDIVLWELPKTIEEWSKSEGLLINTDWNGANYGHYADLIDKSVVFNAGILGFPPLFHFELPNIECFDERFLTEQGFITNIFTSSGRSLFVLGKNEIFQSNANEYVNCKVDNLINNYCGAHFCGCNYAHYQHWDKFYKDEVWKYYHKKDL